MKALWLVVAGLGLIYLVIWAAGKPPSSGATPTPTVEATVDSSSAGLAELAKGDAISRSPSGASIRQQSIKPAFFKGDDLQSVRSIGPGVTAGFEIVLVAEVNNQPVSKMTYHAVPPSKIVFVKQEAVK